MDRSEIEDEYEYEYDDTQTETFFVDVDLSSLNSDIRSDILAVPKRVTPAKRKIDGSTTQTPDLDEPSPHAAGSAAEEAGAPIQEPQDTSSCIAASDQHALLPFPSRVQILDLDSVNPILSYQGQVFSCTWSDMVGTNMFFTHPETLDAAETLRSAGNYDLIGMSRIKLIGHRAKMTKKERPTNEARTDSDAVSAQPTDSNDAPRVGKSGVQTREKQASFLEKLMEIKRQRGETDVVRTYVDDKIASADLAKVHEFHRDEIQALNIKVLRGDGDALARLQEIYSQSDENGPESPETL